MQTIEDLGTYTFPAMLANSVRKFSDRPALSLVNGEPITYSQLEQKSKGVSALLESFGLGPLSKVAIWGIGRPEWGAAYLGIVNRRMIAVPLLPDFSKNDIKGILNHCGVDAMIVDRKLYDKIKDLTEELPPVIIRLEDYSVIAGTQTVSVSPENLAPVTVEEEDTASIIYTSGTTGRPKGVELTHKNLVWNTVANRCCHEIKETDKALSFLPLSHVYEFTIGFSMMILNGASVYYLGTPPAIGALLPAFQKIRPTLVLSVPMIMEKIYKNKVQPSLNAMKLYKIKFLRKLLHRIAGQKLMKTFGGHIEFFGIGGAKLNPEVESFLKDADFPYAIGYGLTETSPLIAGCDSHKGIPGTIGRVVTGVDLQLINVRPDTGIGEIVVKGPNVMKGYYKAPELTAEVFTTKADSCGEGYLKTGDLGILTECKDGMRLSLRGRCKNMILGPNGENIYPEDLEFVLNQHPMVNESLVVENNNGLVALVQVNEEQFELEAKKRTQLKFPDIKEYAEEFMRAITEQKDLILKEIQNFVNGQINRNSRISEVQVIKEFEKTASQKIKRYLYTA